jgi:cytochrome bd-type quinol oxidase subunit 1
MAAIDPRTLMWTRACELIDQAMGVVTGLVMSYQIGTNWSVFAERTANVIGPFFTYEVLTAFFLEAGFVGVMLFGMNRVSARLHFLMPCCCARCAHQRILDFGFQ